MSRCLYNENGGKSDVRTSEVASWKSVSRTGQTQGVSDRRWTPDARPCACADQRAAEASGGARGKRLTRLEQKTPIERQFIGWKGNPWTEEQKEEAMRREPDRWGFLVFAPQQAFGPPRSEPVVLMVPTRHLVIS